MVASPVMSRLAANYKAMSGDKDVRKGNSHREQTGTAEKELMRKIKGSHWWSGKGAPLAQNN